MKRSLTDAGSSISRTALTGFLFLLIIIGLGTAWADKIPEETQEKIKGVRVPFILNQGQVDRQVQFYAKTFNGTVYVTGQGKVVYQLPNSKEQKNQGWVLVEETLDGLPVKEIKGEKASETQVSFFMGNDRSKWQSGLPTYETVNLGEIYKGIGLKLQAYGGRVEKLYYVSPGREPKEIRIKVEGAESLKVNDQGELEVQTGNGPVVFSRPRAFQQEGTNQKEVEVAYVVDRNRYGFKVGIYDKSRELVIDPLIQSTYLGGNHYEDVCSMFVSGGNIYVAGNTDSSNFPGTGGGAQPGYGGGGYDTFISLLTADLKQLIQSTFLSGNEGSTAKSLAVSGGNVYVAGSTMSTNFPGTSGGAQPGYGGGYYDAFVSLLTADLKQLVQSTYLGGTDYDQVQSLAVSGGKVYLAGYTASTNFPGTSGGVQPVFGGGADAFVALLAADLKLLVQSTYLGGTGYDFANSLVVSDGNIYVAGSTDSNNFPGTGGGAQPGYGGGYEDAFISLLTADLKQLVQSTYVGGSDRDESLSLAVSGGNVYVAGSTMSTNFPANSGGALSEYPGIGSGFVSLLTADLKQLIQSTYLNGTESSLANSLAVSGGNVYVAGFTSSSDFPGTSGGVQPVDGGGADSFVSLLTADLKQLVQSTYLGGDSHDYAYSMVASNGNIYVAGHTKSGNFPGTSGGAQPLPPIDGGLGGPLGDAFVALLSTDLRAPLTSANADTSGTAMAAFNNGIAVDFGSIGLWFYNGTAWSLLTSANPEALATYAAGLVGDFGPIGLWEYNGTAWRQLTPANADNTGTTMVAFNGGIAVDFGGIGLWFYNGTAWSLLTPANPEALSTYTAGLVGDFGPIGLWEYNGTAWRQLTPANADNTGNTMVAFNGGIAVDFGPIGLFFYNGTAWSRLTPANPEALTSYASGLVGDFGPIGLWEYNGTAWRQLTTANADNTGITMVAFNGGIAVDFGLIGVWFYNGITWSLLTPANPEGLATYDTRLMGDFGQYGLWNIQ